MNLLFHLRSGADTKPGGDVTLLRTFGEALRVRGHNVQFAACCHPVLDSYDACMTANLDSPAEAYKFLQHAKRHACPTVIYTLHHPDRGVMDYLNQGLHGVRKYIALLAFSDPLKYRWLLTMLKCLLNIMQRNEILPLSSTKYQQRYLLRHADAIAVSSTSELTTLNDDLNCKFESDKVHLIPHIYKPFRGDRSIKRIKRRVVFAGRVESRKNQLAVANIVKDFPGCEFIFVGKMNPTERGYYARLHHTITAHRNATLIDGMGLDEYRALLSTAEILISASWFEVVSLIEIDAYLAGCKLVVTRNSYLHEFISDGLYQFDPTSEIELKTALRRALIAHLPNQTNTHVNDSILKMNGEKVAERLEHLFCQITKEGVTV